MIRSETEYNFHKIQTSDFLACVTHTELASRLWDNFRWRGYIPHSAIYTPNADVTGGQEVKDDLISQVSRISDLFFSFEAIY